MTMPAAAPISVSPFMNFAKESTTKEPASASVRSEGSIRTATKAIPMSARAAMFMTSTERSPLNAPKSTRARTPAARRISGRAGPNRGRLSAGSITISRGDRRRLHDGERGLDLAEELRRRSIEGIQDRVRLDAVIDDEQDERRQDQEFPPVEVGDRLQGRLRERA